MTEVLNPDTVCRSCKVKWTSDNEWVGDVFMCFNLQEYCLNCCGCPDHKWGEPWYDPKEELMDKAVYSVWVGGGEVNDYYLTLSAAENLANEYKLAGYDEVYIEATKEEK